jgi:hypothetical protein
MNGYYSYGRFQMWLSMHGNQIESLILFTSNGVFEFSHAANGTYSHRIRMFHARAPSCFQLRDQTKSSVAANVVIDVDIESKLCLK